MDADLLTDLRRCADDLQLLVHRIEQLHHRSDAAAARDLDVLQQLSTVAAALVDVVRRHAEQVARG